MANPASRSVHYPIAGGGSPAPPGTGVTVGVSGPFTLPAGSPGAPAAGPAPLPLGSEPPESLGIMERPGSHAKAVWAPLNSPEQLMAPGRYGGHAARHPLPLSPGSAPWPWAGCVPLGPPPAGSLPCVCFFLSLPVWLCGKLSLHILRALVPAPRPDLLPAALVVGTAATVTGRRVVLAEGDTRCCLLRARELLEKMASGGGRMKQKAGRSQALSSPGSLSAALVLLATSLWALNLS
ncbi:uncharacterized protein LOC128154254 [Harpia harpyja]|uniref:uncharacterized protein LOC128154254 n=1 Tax=Harpia harpyja TaxID=202280 RepID=UPI0022B1E84F|nr:uncharacterized protein LOC128154254 [Harpia harpyja]